MIGDCGIVKLWNCGIYIVKFAEIDEVTEMVDVAWRKFHNENSTISQFHNFTIPDVAPDFIVPLRGGGDFTGLAPCASRPIDEMRLADGEDPAVLGVGQ